MEYPNKGTPQGGIISPLLANIVLNELDHWVDSQWQKHPVTRKYSTRKNKAGCEILSNGYTAMKLTNLKEMRIVRYADDFRIFCRTKTDAEKAMIAITQWLQERLKLEVSPEKTRVVNVKRRYSEFLGFKIKTYPKGNKRVVKSHICDKALKKQKQRFIEQAKNVAKPRPGKEEIDEIKLYNSMVMGTQNYYKIATMEVLYAIDKTKGADFLKALNLTDGKDRYTNADTLDSTKYFYQSDVLIDALAAALESNSTVVKNALEAYIAVGGGAAMPLTDSYGKTKAENLNLGLYLVVETKVVYLLLVYLIVRDFPYVVFPVLDYPHLAPPHLVSPQLDFPVVVTQEEMAEAQAFPGWCIPNRKAAPEHPEAYDVLHTPPFPAP